jgi:hypothetical protein
VRWADCSPAGNTAVFYAGTAATGIRGERRVGPSDDSSMDEIKYMGD